MLLSGASAARGAPATAATPGEQGRRLALADALHIRGLRPPLARRPRPRARPAAAAAAAAAPARPAPRLELVATAGAPPETAAERERQHRLAAFRALAGAGFPVSRETGAAAPFASDAAAAAAVRALVAAGAGAAAAGLRLLPPHGGALAAAAAALAARRSRRGLAAVERAAARLPPGAPAARAAWVALVRAYGALDDTAGARRAFRTGRAAGALAAGDTRAANVLLYALRTDARLAFVRGRQLLDGGLRPDASTFNALLAACIGAHDARRAALAERWMAAAGVAPDQVTYDSLVKAYSYSGRFDLALAVRDRMAAAGVAPSPQVLGSLLVAAGGAGQPEAAAILWREAAAAAGGAAALPAGAHAALMTAYVRAGQGERALGVLRAMRAAGPPPDARCWNVALSACGAGPRGARVRPEQLRAALALLAGMKAAAADAAARGVEPARPDAVTYGTLIELAARAGDADAAEALHAEMEAAAAAAGRPELRPNVAATTSLIKALGAAGRAREAVAAFGRVVWGPARSRPNRGTYAALVRALREAGALGAALDAYRGMRAAGHAPSNAELGELLAAAAEAALARGDGALRARVAALCGVDSPAGADLHGRSALEARAAALCVLSLAAARFDAAGGLDADVVFITGRGEHSAGEPVLRRAVVGLLEGELKIAGVVAAAEAGAPPRPGAPAANPGRVVVPREAAAAWLAARAERLRRHAAAAAAEGGGRGEG